MILIILFFISSWIVGMDKSNIYSIPEDILELFSEIAPIVPCIPNGLNDEVLEQLTKYVCAICQKKFNNFYALNSHKKAHIHKPLECLYCGKEYKYKESLHNHIEHCTGSNESNSDVSNKLQAKYICAICRKEFNNHYSFNAHKNLHKTQKNCH